MMTITENDKMTNYIVKLQIKLFLNQFERGKWVEHFTVQCYIGKALIVCFVVPSSGLCINLVIARFMYLFGTCHSWCHRDGDRGWELGGQKTTPERVQRYERQLTAQQKNERWQDNSDRRRLARQHPSNLLHSLTCEQDRRRTARGRLNRSLKLRHFIRSKFPHAQHEAHDAHAYIVYIIYVDPIFCILGCNYHNPGGDLFVLFATCQWKP